LYGELFTTYRWNLFVGFMLHVIQQFTGINIIQYYGPAVLKDAGFAGDSNNDLLYSMIFLSSVNTVGNFIGLSLSSKYGRRELIMKSMIPMGISLIVLAGAMVVNTTMSSPVTRQCNNYVIINHLILDTGWICIASLSAYLLIFCIGFAAQPWTICTEIFPVTLRLIMLNFIGPC
jgi:MFS family permease